MATGALAQSVKPVSPTAAPTAVGTSQVTTGVSVTPARVAPVSFSRVYLQAEGAVGATVIGPGSQDSASPVDFKKAVIQTGIGKAFVLSKGADDGAPLDLGQGTLSAEAVGEPIYVEVGSEVKVSANKIFVADQEIKVMPDAASEVAVARLGDLGFKIELKSVGSGNTAKAVYEVEAVRPVRLIGIIPVGLPVRIEIDAQTGAATPVVSPWWGFLVR